MTEIDIRPAHSSEAETISALIVRAIQISNVDDYPPRDIPLICADFSPDRTSRDMIRREMFVALLDETIVATVSLEDEKLHSLFVAPDHQRRGIAGQLVDFIETKARGKGVQVLQLSSSITAIPFYEATGFTLLDYEPRNYGSTWRMEKRL